MKYEKIDKSRFAQLVRTAKAKGDFSDNELGDIVSYLCRIRLTASNYYRYTEDWQLEMMGNAALAVFKAMESTACVDDETKLFNYVYTVIDNSFKKSIIKLNALPVPEDSETPEADPNGLKPFYLRNKYRITRGLVKDRGREVVSVASKMKLKLLDDVLDKAARVFSETLKIEEINQLIAMARSAREAAC